MAYNRIPKLNPNNELQAYAIGLAIGDGNLSRPTPRAVRLRITCDIKYPKLLQRVVNTLRDLLPENKVSTIKKKGCVDVSVYSNHLEKLCGWRVGKGPKFIQNVTIPVWIRKKQSYLIACLKGLIETDGCVYADRGYKMVVFSSLNEILARDVLESINSLGFKSHIYKMKHPENRFGITHKYQVRLSKNVAQFLSLVQVDKS